MTKGIHSYGRKERREVRRRNHIAYDLKTNKYRQRIKEGKPKMEPDEDDDFFDYDYEDMYEDYYIPYENEEDL
jgi:hypothetical protein